MRVAIVEPTARGGMIHYAFQLARALSATGVEVILVTDRHYELQALQSPFEILTPLRLWDPTSAAAPRGWRAPRRLGRGLRYYASWLRLILVLKKLQPDFVLFGDIRFPADALLLAALRRLGLRLIDICHNVRPFSLHGPAGGGFSSGRWRRACYRWAYAQFERTYVHFASNRERFLRSFPIPDARVGVIPHGNEAIFDELRDPAFTANGLRSGLGLEPEHAVILLFGSLSRYKGADLLLEAFSRLAGRAPQARLLLVGRPLPDADPELLRARARRLGCEDRVSVVDEYVQSGQVAAWMELADIAVFPYRQVFQSGALAVAQTYGVPCVVTSVGAMTEATDGDRCAVVVPPEDPVALADGLLRLLRDEELARELGRRARQRAAEEGDWRRIAAAIRADLEQLLSGPSAHIGSIRRQEAKS